MSARGGHNDPRYKNGVRKQYAPRLIDVLLMQADDPVQNGWHFDKEAGRYELTHCSLTAWLRRATLDEVKHYGLDGLPWLVGFINSDHLAAYHATVRSLTQDVKNDLYRLALKIPVVDDGNSWGG